MSDTERTPERFSLKRWSTRKLDAARASEAAPLTPSGASAPAAAASATPAQTAATPAVRQGTAMPELPPVESLTFESDFSAFLTPKVAEPLKRQALKKLFSDPRFNVMDGLDVYIDDYSVPSPLDPDLVKQLVHARFTLDPPPTRVNAQGHVEDVPPEEIAVPDSEAAPATPAIAATPQPTDTIAPPSAPEEASSVASPADSNEHH